MPLIPKNIHFIWLGQPIPEKYAKTIAKLSRLAQASNFSINLWTDNPQVLEKSKFLEDIHIQSSKIPYLSIRNISELEHGIQSDDFYKKYNRARRFKEILERERHGLSNLAAAADLLRYEILREEGGYYFDTDTKFFIGNELKLTPDNAPEGILINCDSSDAMNNDIIAVAPNHAVMENAISMALFFNECLGMISSREELNSLIIKFCEINNRQYLDDFYENFYSRNKEEELRNINQKSQKMNFHKNLMDKKRERKKEYNFNDTFHTAEDRLNLTLHATGPMLLSLAITAHFSKSYKVYRKSCINNPAYYAGIPVQSPVGDQTWLSSEKCITSGSKGDGERNTWDDAILRSSKAPQVKAWDDTSIKKIKTWDGIFRKKGVFPAEHSEEAPKLKVGDNEGIQPENLYDLLDSASWKGTSLEKIEHLVKSLSFDKTTAERIKHALETSIIFDNIEVVKLLCTLPDNLSPDKTSTTEALISAISMRSEKAAEFLIEFLINTNSFPTKKMYDVFFIAAASGQLNILKFLFNMPCFQPEQLMMDEAIVESARLKKWSVVEYLSQLKGENKPAVHSMVLVFKEAMRYQHLPTVKKLFYAIVAEPANLSLLDNEDIKKTSSSEDIIDWLKNTLEYEKINQKSLRNNSFSQAIHLLKHFLNTNKSSFFQAKNAYEVIINSTLEKVKNNSIKNLQELITDLENSAAPSVEAKKLRSLTNYFKEKFISEENKPLLPNSDNTKHSIHIPLAP